MHYNMLVLVINAHFSETSRVNSNDIFNFRFKTVSHFFVIGGARENAPSFQKL